MPSLPPFRSHLKIRAARSVSGSSGGGGKNGHNDNESRVRRVGGFVRAARFNNFFAEKIDFKARGKMRVFGASASGKILGGDHRVRSPYHAFQRLRRSAILF